MHKCEIKILSLKSFLLREDFYNDIPFIKKRPNTEKKKSDLENPVIRKIRHIWDENLENYVDSAIPRGKSKIGATYDFGLRASG